MHARLQQNSALQGDLVRTPVTVTTGSGEPSIEITDFQVDEETGDTMVLASTIEVEYSEGATTIGSIAFASTSGIGIAGGTNGYIARSTDGGDTWSTIHDGDHATLGLNHGLGVAAAPDNDMVVLGGAGFAPLVMVRSTNDGATWTAATDALSAGVSGIANLSDIQLWGGQSVTYGGSIFVAVVQENVGGRVLSLVSSDGGATWSAYEAMPADANPAPRRVRYINGAFYFCAWDDTASQHAVFRSTDGQTWTKTLLAGSSTNTTAIDVVWGGGSNILIFGAFGGTTLSRFTSTDNGSTWSSAANVSSRQNANRAEYLDGRVFVWENGNIAYSTNLGVAWTTVGSATINGSAHTANDGTRLFAGYNGEIIGFAFAETYPPEDGYRLGFAHGDADLVIGETFVARSTTPGEWVDQSLLGVSGASTGRFRGIAMNDERAVAAGFDLGAGNSLMLLYSSDAGATWTKTATNLTSVIASGVVAPMALVAYGAGLFVVACCDGDGKLNAAVSANDGVTWAPHLDVVASLETLQLYRLRFLDGAFFALLHVPDGSAAYVAKSTDGETWSVAELGGAGYRLGADMTADGAGLVVVGVNDFESAPEYVMWRSSDGGATWERSTVSGFGDVSEVVPWSITEVDGVLIVGALLQATVESAVFTSTDGGSTWDGVPDDIGLGDTLTIYEIAAVDGRLAGVLPGFMFGADYEIVPGETSVSEGALNAQLSDSLETAVILSLFTDRRVPNDIDHEGDRRGWWASTYLEDEWGSLLWTLKGETPTEDNFRRAEKYAVEALEWMKRDGIASEIRATATFVDSGSGWCRLSIEIRSGRGPLGQWRTVWEGTVNGL